MGLLGLGCIPVCGWDPRDHWQYPHSDHAHLLRKSEQLQQAPDLSGRSGSLIDIDLHLGVLHPQ